MESTPVGAAGQKRIIQPGQQPRSRKIFKTYAVAARKHFQPTPEDILFLKENTTPKMACLMRPKGRIEHGIRLDFGERPRLINEILATFKKVYPNATVYHLYSETALIDLGFSTEVLADKAADIPFKIDGIILPCIRTRSPRDISIQVRLDSLPTTLPSEQLESELSQGLKAYGKLLDLTIATDPRVPHLSGSNAVATVVPHIEAGKREEFISQVSSITSAPNEPFLVAPIGTPFFCGNCFDIGHISSKCTATTEQLLTRSNGISWGLLKNSATVHSPKISIPLNLSQTTTETLSSTNISPPVNTSKTSSLLPKAVAKKKLIYNLPELPALHLPPNMNKVTAESIHEYCNHIQTLLAKQSKHMQTLGKSTKHTRSTREALSAIHTLCPEIEAAIITYLTELDNIEVKVSSVDPVFYYELDDMGHENPYLETLEARSQAPVYGLMELPPLLLLDE